MERWMARNVFRFYGMERKRHRFYASYCMVPLHWNSHVLKTILLLLGQKPRKTPKKQRHFEVASLLRLELLRYYEGACRHYRLLVEGLMYWNSLVSSSWVFLFGRHCQKVFGGCVLFGHFCDFGAIFGFFVVLNATRIVPHACIALLLETAHKSNAIHACGTIRVAFKMPKIAPKSQKWPKRTHAPNTFWQYLPDRNTSWH